MPLDYLCPKCGTVNHEVSRLRGLLATARDGAFKEAAEIAKGMDEVDLGLDENDETRFGDAAPTQIADAILARAASYHSRST